jgi:hypothetical protein
MIQTQGFASTQSVDSLADEINRWLISNSQAMDSKFRLINIQYSSTSEVVPNSSELGRVNYSALVIYEFIEVKKTEDSTEPLVASGVE